MEEIVRIHFQKGSRCLKIYKNWIFQHKGPELRPVAMRTVQQIWARLLMPVTVLGTTRVPR